VAVLVGILHATAETERVLDQEEAYEASALASQDGMTDLIQESAGVMAPAAATAPPKSKQVKIVGDTSVLATMRMFAEGDNLLQVTDSTTGYGMMFGTNSKQKDHIRMRPTKGKGLAINSKGDKVGLFVDAASGYVGVGHSAPKSHLHVKGTTYSTGTITTTATGSTAALQLSGVSDFHGIQFNKDGKKLYLIGRGKGLAERELSFHVPSAADYGGGKEPKFKWVSGAAHETLAHLEASTGNMYVKGRVGIGAIQPKAALDVRGSLNLENGNAEAVITFPRGKTTGFHIRSTNNPGTYTSADDRLYIKGSNGFVGIQTTKPKAMLDVRGALNLQDASSAAVIYFPSKGASSSFFIRCADNPAQYSEEQERLFIGSNGKVGIGTNKPTHGLTVSSAAGQGSPLNDVAIMKGNLKLSGGIYDTFGGGKKYFIDLKKKSFLKTVNVETMLGVGTAKPVGLPGSNAAVHIQGKAPVLRVENTKAAGSAVVSLQTGGNTWDMEGTTGAFRLKNNGKARLTIADDGKIGIGERATNPKYGLMIETDAPKGNKRNDLSIRRGHLWLWGSIKQIGNPKYSFSMDKGGFIAHLNIEGNLGIGLFGKKPKFAVQLGKGQTFNIGNQMFFAGENGNAYISANTYRKGGKWQLFKRNAGGSALILDRTGAVKLVGTRKAGTPKLDTMFTVDAKTQTATFPMTGMKAGFGTASPQYPLQVNGARAVGETQASIGFGMSETSMGYLGSNQGYVYMATSAGKEALAIDHNTGYVGIGTQKPKTTLHLASNEGPALSFGSTQNKATHAYIKGSRVGSGLNMVFGIKNPTKAGGKLTFDFQNEMKFGGSGSTVFARGDTIFKTGNVGIGGSAFDAKFKLHVKGSMMVDGKVFVAARKPGTKAKGAAKKGAAKKAAKKPAAKKKGKEEQETEDEDLGELDFTDLLEENEGRTENVSKEHGIDLHETLHGLVRVLRKQHKQMDTHDHRISELSSQMSTLMQ
jgi:hypothetical protein